MPSSNNNSAIGSKRVDHLDFAQFSLDDHPHRKPLVYSAVQDKLLKRSVLLAPTLGALPIRFKLVDLIEALKAPVFALKGSSVRQWTTMGPLHDIDLQIPQSTSDGPHDAETQSQILQQTCVDFITSKTTAKGAQPPNHRNLQYCARISQIARHADGAWLRTVIRLGVAQPNCSTIDINYTQGEKLGYDTLSASSILLVNRHRQAALQAEVISPELADWMRDNSLVWFNPEMNSGLQRVSYRLAQNPSLQCLQPDLIDRFIEDASDSDIKTVMWHLLRTVPLDQAEQKNGMSAFWRSLCGQLGEAYPQATEAVRNLWSPTVYDHFSKSLLDWAGSNSLSGLLECLTSVEHQPKVLDNLRTACRTAMDFRKDLRQLLDTWTDARVWMNQHGSACLGYSLIEPQQFFDLLDQANWIGLVPEVELKMVFEPLLNTWANQLKEPCRAKAQIVLGWLDQEPRGKLVFWLHRIPAQNLKNPSPQQSEPVLKCLMEMLSQETRENNWPAGIEHLVLSRLQLQNLAESALAELDKQPSTSWGQLNWPSWLVSLVLQEKFQDLASQLGRHLQTEDTWSNELIQQAHALSSLAEQSRKSLDNTAVQGILRNAIRRESNGYKLHLSDHIQPVFWSEGQLRGDTGPVSTTLKQGPAWIQSNAARRNKTQHRILWADHGKVVCTGGEVADTPKDHLFLRADTLGPSERPVFECLLTLLEAHCGQRFDLLGNIRAYGRCNERMLLQSATASAALQSLQKGILVWHGPQDIFRIVVDVDNHQPKECHVAMNGHRGLPSISARFESTGQGWQVQPVHDDIWSYYEVGFEPLCTSVLRMRRQLNLAATPSLSNAICIEHREPPAYRFYGIQLDLQRMASAGALEILEPTPMRLEFDDHSAPDGIPIQTLALMAELMGERRRGILPLLPRLHNGRLGIPPVGYEGFVHGLGNDTLSISGYLWPNGRMIGCMQAELNEAHGLIKRAWIGSFLLKRPHENADWVGLKHSVFTASPLQLAVVGRQSQSVEGILMPHGYCEEHLLSGDASTRIIHDRKVYFGGHGRSTTRITRKPQLIFDSPDEPGYFVGQYRDARNNPMMSHLVMQAPDGGPDFVMTLPAHAETIRAYNLHLSDTAGFGMTLLLKDHTPQHGHLQFPGGLEMRCGLRSEGQKLRPAGKGNIQFNGLDISISLTEDGTLMTFSGRDDHSKAWLSTKRLPQGLVNTLPQLILLMSNGNLHWKTDCEPHLRMRDLEVLKPRAEVFGE
ncbi:MAG TPA: hypothetical protein VGE55_04785 [Limnobacter sp.]|uniref:hypothetical protein n=1 Tax=Limnobacter sp. TaxID=2003368 RepID=UPI002EDBB0FD